MRKLVITPFIAVMMMAILLFGCHSRNKSVDTHSLNEILYANRSCAGRFYGEDGCLYYANVFDELKLYRYDIDANKVSLMTEDVHRVQFISEYDGKLYFSALSLTNDSLGSNIYRIDKNGDSLELVLENSKAPLIMDGYMFYHDSLDPYAYGVYRMNLKSGQIDELIDKTYECSAMTINIVDNILYAGGLTDIIACDLTTLEIENITRGMHKYGINKLQYSDGYLYYYTYAPEASIMRYEIESKRNETVCVLNDGDFWLDVLLVDGNNIIFTGSQTQALREEQNESMYIVGTYICSAKTGDIRQISRVALGPTCYIYDNKIIALHTLADAGKNQVIIMDYEGNLLNDFSAMQSFNNLIE